MPMVPRDFSRNVSELVPEIIADVEAFLGIAPTPVTFTQQPTVTPLTGTAGEVTFTATPGLLSDGSTPTRAWLLNGSALATTLSYAPDASIAGNLSYQEYGPDGAMSDPISVTVAAPGGTPTPTPGPPFTVLFGGSSTFARYFTEGTAPTNTQTTMSADGTTFTPVTGAGAGTFADLLQKALNRPIRLIATALGGTTAGEWDNGGDTRMQAALNAGTAAGGIDLACMQVGWNDARANNVNDQAAHETKLRNMFAALRNRFGSGLPIALGMSQKWDDSAADADQFSRLYLAENAVLNDAGIIFYAQSYDLPQVDAIHMTTDSYPVHATRGANNVLAYMAGQPVARGPMVLSYTSESTTSTLVTLAHSTGADIAGVGATTVWRLKGDQTPTSLITPTAVTKVSANSVRLTHTAITSGTVYVRCLYSARPPATSLYDNLGAPLNPSPLPMLAGA